MQIDACEGFSKVKSLSDAQDGKSQIWSSIDDFVLSDLAKNVFRESVRSVREQFSNKETKRQVFGAEVKVSYCCVELTI